MLTKRQKNERYLSMFTFLFGLLMLMTLFVPSAKGERYTFMGLDIVFGDAIYGPSEAVVVLFSWFNFMVYFLPIIGGIMLVLIDRVMLHESKIKLMISVLPVLMFIASLVLMFFIPRNTSIMIGDIILQEQIEFYVGPFFAIGFIIAGMFTSFMYLVQEGKIHQMI